MASIEVRLVARRSDLCGSFLLQFVFWDSLKSRAIIPSRTLQRAAMRRRKEKGDAVRCCRGRVASH